MAATPTADELAGMRTLQQVATWCSLTGDPEDAASPFGALCAAIGGGSDTQPRVIGILPEADFASVICSLLIGSRQATEGVDEVRGVPPSLVARGALTLAGHVCRCVAGFVPSSRETAAADPRR